MVAFPLPVAILHDFISAPCALSKLLRLGSGNEVIQDGDRSRRAVLPWGVYHYIWRAAQMFCSWSSIFSQICVRKLQRDPAPPSHLGVNINPARLVGQWKVIFCHVNRYHIHVILSFSYTSISCHQSYSLSKNSKDFSQNKTKIILCCMWHGQNRNFLLERDTCYLGSSQLSDAFAWWRHQMKKKISIAGPHRGQWCGALIFYPRLNKRLSEQSKHQWFETPSRTLWRYFKWGHDTLSMQQHSCLNHWNKNKVCLVNPMVWNKIYQLPNICRLSCSTTIW